MAFVPVYHLTPHAQQLLVDITTLKNKIDSATVSVSWIPSLSRDASSRTARSSTAIEGNPLSLKEVQVLADGGDLPGVGDRHKQEVLNTLAALKFVSEHSEQKVVTTKDVLRLHKIIGKDALERGPVGEFRPYDVSVDPYEPPPFEKVSALIDELASWLNGPGQEMPAIITSAILHCQFETIHPFGDGNGRVGRMLATWELYRRQFDIHHIFAVDEVFYDNRQLYYKALYRVQSGNADFSGWIEFACEAIQLTLERVWERIVLVRSGNVSGEKIVLTPKQEALIKILRDGPLGIHDIQGKLKVTRPGAHFILKPLVERGILKRVGGYRTGKYALI